MNEDVKAYLIAIGAFIVSIVSFLSDLLDFESNHCEKSLGE